MRYTEEQDNMEERIVSGEAAYASACPISGDGLLFPQADPEPSGDGCHFDRQTGRDQVPGRTGRRYG